jgi:hypothetical protein
LFACLLNLRCHIVYLPNVPTIISFFFSSCTYFVRWILFLFAWVFIMLLPQEKSYKRLASSVALVAVYKFNYAFGNSFISLFNCIEEFCLSFLALAVGISVSFRWTCFTQFWVFLYRLIFIRESKMLYKQNELFIRLFLEQLELEAGYEKWDSVCNVYLAVL